MTSAVIPSTGSQVLSLNALGLGVGGGEVKTKAKTLDLSTNADTDTFRAHLADFVADELGGSADLGAGTVDVAGGFLPWGILLGGLEDEVVIPAFADLGEFVGMGGSVGGHIGSFAVSVGTFVCSGSVIADGEAITLGETLARGGWTSMGENQEKGRGEEGLKEHDE